MKPDVIILVAEQDVGRLSGDQGRECVSAYRQFTIARQPDARRAYFKGNKDRRNVLTFDMRSGRLTSGYRFVQPIYRLSDIV